MLYSFGSHPNDGTDGSGIVWGADGNLYGTTQGGGTSNDGTVFKLTPLGDETVLYSFSGAPDGNDPYAGLMQTKDGDFYGITSTGGTFGFGAVFKITPAGSLTILYSFAGGTADGENPEANVILATDGNLYGTTDGGGATRNGTVYKLTPQGVETVLYSFTGGLDGAAPENLIQGSDGNLYGEARQYGAYGLGVFFELTLNGTYTTLHAFGNTDGGLSASNGFVEGTDGNFYGAAAGGASSKGSIWKMTPSGTTTVLYSFVDNGMDGIYPNAGFIQASSGILYGTTEGGGTGNAGTVYSFDLPTGTESVVYSLSPLTDGQIPLGLIQGADGNLYGVMNLNGPHGAGGVFRVVLD